MLVQRPRTLTLGERIYLPGIFKGLWLTLKHIFGPKVTLPRYEKVTLALAAWGRSQLAVRTS